MVRNQEKVAQAEALRKRGFTLAEIAKVCDVSKATVSNWLKNKAFSEVVSQQNKRRVGQENAKRLRLIAKTRGTERKRRAEDAVRAADTEFKHYKSHPLFIAGVVAYATAGDTKDAHQIRLSSAKIDVQTVFIRFVEEYLGIDPVKIHLWLQLYPTHDEAKCMRRWKQATGLSYQQFYKNHVVKHQGATKPLHFGVGNTIIGSTSGKQKLLRWVELLQDDLTT